ncbi:MAG: 50S ribosomal protein L7Ae [Candidatus Micrarchaeia archaeon]
MAKSYVEFEVSSEVMAKTAEALQLAKQSGGIIRKGANEVTKSIERGLASFVVIAADVEPEEVVVHIPKLCAQKKIAYTYLATKEELGKAIGINVPCAAVAVESQGNASALIKEVIAKTTGTVSKDKEAKEAPKQEKTEKKEQKEQKQPKSNTAPK